jgi:hypothetical protein
VIGLLKNPVNNSKHRCWPEAQQRQEWAYIRPAAVKRTRSDCKSLLVVGDCHRCIGYRTNTQQRQISGLRKVRNSSKGEKHCVPVGLSPTSGVATADSFGMFRYYALVINGGFLQLAC